jgi:hypothetical protein
MYSSGRGDNMQAYEFQTTINGDILKIPLPYSQELQTGEIVKVIILRAESVKLETNQLNSPKNKLSDILLMPEIDENENIFARNFNKVYC